MILCYRGLNREGRLGLFSGRVRTMYPSWEACCQRLESTGVKLNRPLYERAGAQPRDCGPETDPWGRHIELREGLDKTQ